MAGFFSPPRTPCPPSKRRITALRLFAPPHHDHAGVIRRTSPSRASHKSAVSKPYVLFL
ncbi:hypothetical protein CSB93_5872 [Pseudomonas paraeruginosa]|uniref:Uncharacterized protein n=1 Tax=Pseudomonas paraeruginosa TaxID=2994495 RepID=A0A2R3IQ46_9PSED|nr:hypothetical protein CSB93_5872 [Pseudomonas paraeruginosa]AWE90015.1 hypothetical protein CSC28_4670 [Pseudomonas paraeruginosa]